MFTLLKKIGKVADELKVNAYAVGGCVRDTLMGRPTKDLDVVAEGDGMELALQFTRTYKLRPPVVYRRFGTAMVRGWGFEIEFVTARAESYSPDSRKPSIRRATLLEDLKRRDFTINAIAFGINKGNFGRLIDPLRGREDILHQIIRTPLSPDITFNDDPLRMLRAVRFGVELGFMLDREVKRAISSKCWRLSEIVSGERIRDELIKMLLLPTPSRGIQLMEEVGLTQEIFPELMKTKGLPYEDGFYHKDVYHHTLEVLDGVGRRGGSLNLKWAALLHDIGKPHTRRLSPEKGYTFYGHEVVGVELSKELLRRLRLSNKDIDEITTLIKHHMRLNLLTPEVSDRALRRLARELGGMLDDLFILSEADRTGRKASDLHWLLKRIKDATREVVKLKPPLNGHEVMKILGIKQGPKVGEVLKALMDAVIEGQIPPTKEAGKEFILTHFTQ